MNAELKHRGATLTIDLAALQANYRLLSRKVGRADCAAAIKANAYGITAETAATALWAAGCTSFYVARPDEGEELRKILSKATITVLDGLYPGESAYYIAHHLRPTIANLPQAQEWSHHGQGASCALHVDTGINRVGLSSEDFYTLCGDKALLRSLNVTSLMSHLACADNPGHAMNKQQLERFKTFRKQLPEVRASFANSPGIFLGKAFHFDEVRPGVALYGGNPTPHRKNPMKPVAHLHARILQLRDVAKGETVGYAASWKAKRNSRIAIIAAGYADGIARKLSSGPNGGPAKVFIAGERCPVVGRVSMDMMTIDVTDVPERKLANARSAELFGKNITVDEVAGWAGTISYELLTHLGRRYERVYCPPES